MRRALVHGLGIAGRSTVAALTRRGVDVVASDDMLSKSTADAARALGADVIDAADAVAALAGVDTLVPAPGVPETHPVIAAAAERRCEVVSEIELAARYEDARDGGPRPMLAVTGTDGKTTTTLLVAAILRAAGRDPAAAGNTELPLLDAIDLDVDCFVVEATSFRLAWTSTFRADGAAWLNLAEDHLNWHVSMASYEAAKAKIFANQRAGDVAVGYAADETVLRHLRRAPGRQRTFALDDADYRVEDGWLVGPHGALADVARMRRSLPHDLTNALAAAAITTETGLAESEAVAAAVARFTGPRHRLELVGEQDGVRWFNDSKATTPHAASAALRAFPRVVLIAGGLNKGLDLSPMAAESERVSAVVTIGRDAADVAAVFHDRTRVVAAESMGAAVWTAAELAKPGDVILLSPGCASFDWYEGGFEARGDDFRALVRELFDRAGEGAPT